MRPVLPLGYPPHRFRHDGRGHDPSLGAAPFDARLRRLTATPNIASSKFDKTVFIARSSACASAPPAWNTLPCWYLLGTEDKAIPPELQRFMAERANATIVEVPASHVSFVSQPEAATQLILQAVEATAAAG